jgi:hypothetical protein
MKDRFVDYFIQPTYKSDMCFLNMWKTHVFLLINAIKKACEKHMLLK